MDKYDVEIERLADDSAIAVRNSWFDPGPLFKFASPDGNTLCYTADGKRLGPECGCLTSIRLGQDVAWTPELTAAIRADERLPPGGIELSRGWDDLTREARIARLTPFAEWQRRLDTEIRGK